MADDNQADLTKLTVELLSAYLANNKIESGDLPTLIASTRASLSSTPSDTTEPVQEFVPAVSIRKSLSSKDVIISLIDGKPYKTLKRHLTTHGLTQDEYRSRYNLPVGYPLVAPSYSERRREVAAANGLGRAKRSAPSDSQVKDATAPKAAAAKPAKAKAVSVKAPKIKTAQTEAKLDGGPAAAPKATRAKAVATAKPAKAAPKKRAVTSSKADTRPAVAASPAPEQAAAAKPRRKLKIAVGGEAKPEPKATSVTKKLVAAAKKFTAKAPASSETAEAPTASSSAQWDEKVSV